MSPLLQGCVCGVVFGAATVASMLPMKFADKRAALIAAFLNRFAIGLLIPLLKGSVASPGWLVGVAVGLLLSLPDAVITKAYAPIIAIGVAGGAIIGALT